MKTTLITLFVIFLIAAISDAQDTICDFDGNVYHKVVIGQQTWLKENLKSLHYSDGTVISGATAYNNDDSLANIFGRLYKWSAAMHGSTTIASQGACPSGWHVPSDLEFQELETFLGGAYIAGDEMKDTTQGMWNNLSQQATNSSGFTARPGGEYDAHDLMIYQLIHEYAVFWTSTEINSQLANQRYIGGLDPGCHQYNWYKSMKYSVRCIRDAGTGIDQTLRKQKIRISNPVGIMLKIINPENIGISSFEMLNLNGQKIFQKYFTENPEFIYLTDIPPGIYIARIHTDDGVLTLKVVKSSIY